MKNRDKGIPDSATSGRILKREFPASFRIFWGPNQKTTYPSDYTEPSGWKGNEILSIPKVARIMETKMVNRYFAVGYFNYAHTVWHQQGRPDDIAFGDICVSPGLIDYYYCSAFHQVLDLADLGANQSTAVCLGAFRDLGVELDKSAAIRQDLFSNNYEGWTADPIFGMVTNTGNAPIGEPESILGASESPPAAGDPSVKWTKTPQTVWAFVHNRIRPDGVQTNSLELYTAINPSTLSQVLGFDTPAPTIPGLALGFGEIHDLVGLTIP